MSHILQRAEHISKISQFIQTGQINKIDKYVETHVSTEIQNELSEWLALVLQKNNALPQKGNLSSPKNLVTQAWQAYFNHEYLQAHEGFKQAYHTGANIDIDVAFGLCKVYTRSGHWHTARDWCLYYLQHVRVDGNIFEIAKGYGALAEIFLRANQNQAALACFQLAYHLMPLGHGQQAKQLNFMASALMRNKEWERAETLLQTSKQMSRNQLNLTPTDQEAQGSLLHSQVRLAFTALFKESPYNCSNPKLIFDENDKVKNINFTMPLGHLYMAHGIASFNHDRTQSHQFFEKSLTYYAPSMLLERYWAQRMCALSADLEQPEPSQAIRALIQLEPIQSPTTNSPVDRTWQKIELNNTGFKSLFEKNMTQNEVMNLWTCFFI